MQLYPASTPIMRVSGISMAPCLLGISFPISSIHFWVACLP